MLGRRLVVSTVLTVFGTSVALACGPFFPWELLDDRAATLKATPVNSFVFEASHLAPPPKDRLKAVETFDYAWYTQESGQLAENAAHELNDAETAGLPTNQILLLKDARAAASGQEALARGKGLPLSILHYTAGAVAWHKGDYAFAKDQFDTVLRMADKDGASRIVWATYMLGRIGAATHDEIGATSGFNFSRFYAARGAPDPLGLAVASYGEEARVHLHAAEFLLDNGGRTPVNPTPPKSQYEQPLYSEANAYSGATLSRHLVEPFRKEITTSIGLYAEQAARGSKSGAQSLRIVAEFLLDSRDRIDAVAGEPLAQRVMVAYALRLTTTNTYDLNNQSSSYLPNAISLDTQLSAQRQKDIFGDLIEVLQKQPNPAGADRIAALCYDRGNWSCAQRFADKSASALASWVKAKLATQAGDLAGAAKFYAAAVHGFPASDSLGEDNKKSVLGEAAVVSLARGEYVDALEKLWSVSGRFWPDVAYLAERVLTTDELKSFVDRRVPAGKAVPKPQYAEYALDPDGEGAFDSRRALRDLLARRLMRDGRYQEAFAYFSSDEVRNDAQAYARALHDAESAWGRVDRAEALFKAATLARRSGMEIMGTEGPPDSYYTDGDFEDGLGRAELKGPHITDGERQRFDASTANPNVRYHYRYVAIDEASNAADLLPAHSQAFAAVLCHATQWTSYDPARGKALYRRYVAQGAIVPWATHFGHNCPAPDFSAAVSMERQLMWRSARRYVSHHRWWFAGGGTLGMLALVWIVLSLTGFAGRFAIPMLARRRKSSGSAPAPTSADLATKGSDDSGSAKP